MQICPHYIHTTHIHTIHLFKISTFSREYVISDAAYAIARG